MLQFNIKLPLTSQSEGTCIIDDKMYNIEVAKLSNKCYIYCPGNHTSFCVDLQIHYPIFFPVEMNKLLENNNCICTDLMCFPEFRYLKDLSKFIKYINNYYSEI